MAGISTGPSFMSRLGGQLPGMANALGQQYGGNMSGMAKSSSSLLNRQKAPSFGGGMRRAKTPGVIEGMGNSPLPGQQIQAPGLQPSPGMGGEINAQMPMAGINTGPSPQLFQQPYGNLFSGTPGYGSGGNTGITGGLFNRPPGYERPNMGAPGIDIGGMFSTYNKMSPSQPRRY